MKYLFLIASMFLIFGCSDDPTASNDFELHIALQSVQTSVNLGENVQLDIQIDECSTPIFGICLQLEFDSEILSFSDSNSVIAGDFFGENFISFAQESAGIIHITFTLTQNEAQISGSGKLCTISLGTISTGTSAVNILSNEISVYDQTGNLIEIDDITINNTQITVLE